MPTDIFLYFTPALTRAVTLQSGATLWMPTLLWLHLVSELSSTGPPFPSDNAQRPFDMNLVARDACSGYESDVLWRRVFLRCSILHLRFLVLLCTLLTYVGIYACLSLPFDLNEHDRLLAHNLFMFSSMLRRAHQSQVYRDGVAALGLLSTVTAAVLTVSLFRVSRTNGT